MHGTYEQYISCDIVSLRALNIFLLAWKPCVQFWYLVFQLLFGLLFSTMKEGRKDRESTPGARKRAQWYCLCRRLQFCSFLGILFYLLVLKTHISINFHLERKEGRKEEERECGWETKDLQLMMLLPVPQEQLNRM